MQGLKSLKLMKEEGTIWPKATRVVFLTSVNVDSLPDAGIPISRLSISTWQQHTTKPTLINIHIKGQKTARGAMIHVNWWTPPMGQGNACSKTTSLPYLLPVNIHVLFCAIFWGGRGVVHRFPWKQTCMYPVRVETHTNLHWNTCAKGAGKSAITNGGKTPGSSFTALDSEANTIRQSINKATHYPSNIYSMYFNKQNPLSLSLSITISFNIYMYFHFPSHLLPSPTSSNKRRRVLHLAGPPMKYV